MYLRFRNVNDAFNGLVRLFKEGGPLVVRRPYSNPNGSGYTLVIDGPVLITYEQPCERVLFNEARDANPFLHLYEALWMLAGCNDVAPLAYYARQVASYSDDGKTLNGAYGYRWRNATAYLGNDDDMHVDQLDLLVSHLRTNPGSRRAVLSMWNVEDDLMKLDSSRDCCCNLNVMFSLRVVPGTTELRPDLQETHIASPHHVLDMTVTNRSNDLVWGLLGTNYVHFTLLQEYMAARLGVGVGRYHHFTNNLHVYDWNWKPEEWLSEVDRRDMYSPVQVKYGSDLRPVPLVRHPDDVGELDKEIAVLADSFRGEIRGPRPEVDQLASPFLRDVAAPLLRAYEVHRTYENTEQALRVCDLIRADDWRHAAVRWLKRRAK